MRTEPPTVINVGGRVITIRIDPCLESWGEYHADEQEIVLAARTLEKQSTLRETLRHEILHVSLDVAGLSHLTVYQEEAIVRCIDNIFHPAWDKVRKQLSPSD